jgi:transposase InsO family protein
MVVDQFTKWVECIPLPSQTAEVTACALVNEFFSRFGYPFELFSDQGRNFESNLFGKLCELLKIHKARTTPYRPSGNGQVERFNRTLLDAVRCFVQKSPGNWDIYISQIAGALRSCVNRNTGFTPNRLMLGRETNQVADMILKSTSSVNTSADDYLSKLEKALCSAHQIARDRLKTTQKRMKRDYDLHVCQQSFTVGDTVYVYCSDSNKGKGKKLMPQWKGPGIIIAKFTPYLYRVKLRNSISTCHHDKMKLCNDTDLPTWVKRFHSKQNTVDPSLPSTGDNNRQDLFCSCRRPANGEFMIQCDGCAEWFHGRCVNTTPREALSIAEYMCSSCS